MDNREDNNQTVIKEFILLGFGNIYEFQILLFLVFLMIYLVTMSGNFLIVVLIVADQHLLHTPMYLFLINFSCLESCYISTIFPKMLDSFLTGNQLIPLNSCFTQLYFFGGLITAECYLLAAMSYDRYLAICKPLHYVTIMDMKTCLQLSGCSWIIGFLVSSIPTYLIKHLVFCGPNVIDHFFCDFTPLLQLSCSNTMKIQHLIFIFSAVFGLLPFLLTLISYGCIIKNILRIPSTVGRKKTFSTCSSHLTVVSLFYGTIVIVYVLPKNTTLRDLNKFCSVFYTILTPLVNPFVYSLRNKDIKRALKKAMKHFSC